MSLKERMARAESYVLGQMDEHERERAERDMEVDTEFCECVLLLAERFRRFDHGDREASEMLWGDVAAHIRALPQMANTASGPSIATAEPVGRGLHEIGGRRGMAVAIALILAFALGYLAGSMG